MEDKDLELEDSQNLTDSDAESSDTQSEEGFASDEEKDEAERLREQNKQLYARLKKLEAKLNKVGNQTSSDSDSWRQKMEFIVRHRDLSADEVEEVISYAHGKKISYEEALNSAFVKAALDKIREQKRAEMAQIESESAKSDVEKKYTPEQLKNMSLEELEKIIPRG